MSLKYFLLFNFLNLWSQVPVVDFNKSMECIDFPKAGNFNLFKQIYYQNSWQNKFLSTANLIPKIIHFIWLGSPLPAQYLPFIATWRKHHSDWEIKVWQDQDIVDFGLKNRYLYDQAANFGYKSDLARYEILERLGGLYVDIDFECVQNFNFLHERYQFYAGLFPHQGIVANGLIACSPNHPIMACCVNNLTQLPKKIQNQEDPDSIQQVSGPIHFTKAIFTYLKANLDDQKIMILPASYLFAFPVKNRADFWSNQAHQVKLNHFCRLESLALHYWGCSWVN